MTNLFDRIARAGLALFGLAGIAFPIAILAALLVAGGEASAAQQCSGRDMLAQLAAEDPERLAAIRKQAADVPNGKGLLWRIESAGTQPSWLYGTMHMSDPRVVGLPAAAQDAYDAARTVVIETTDILDPARMGAALLARPELTMFTDATTLPQLLSEDDRAMVKDELARRGIPLASVQKMKPWMLSALVSLPACELARKSAGAEVLDVKLATDALAAGKEVEGLETIAEQLEAMASLPMEFHVSGLVETLRLGDRVEDVMETMVRMYVAGETGMFWPFFEAALPSAGDDQGYAAFQETMIDLRNRTMARDAAPLIARGGAFVAVGALHLAGRNGLIELLRQRGFAVEAVE